MHESHLSCLDLPGTEVPEDGEENEEKPSDFDQAEQVSRWSESKARIPRHNRHAGRENGDGEVGLIPEEAHGQFIWEAFEDPDDRLRDSDPERGYALLRDGFQVEELASEAEERAERFMKAQRQLVCGYFARRRNPLYQRAATSALSEAGRPEPSLVLLWNFLGDRYLEVEPDEQEEVSQWVSGLSEEDFLFFTQDPEGDSGRVIHAGILPGDLQPMRLFQEQRNRLVRVLVRESDFFHPDENVFRDRLSRSAHQIAQRWNLDAEGVMALAREERSRFYQIHLEVCRISAAFSRGKPAPTRVSAEAVAEVASVAYGRMNHPDYKARALAFAGLHAEEARKRFSHLDRFMEDFYASRLFSSLKRAMLIRKQKENRFTPVVEDFVATFRTGTRPKGLASKSAREVAALALYETVYGGFRGHGISAGRPSTLYRPQILTWGGFADLEEAKRVHQSIEEPESLRRVLFPAIAKMAREDRLHRATVLLKAARRAYRESMNGHLDTERLSTLRESIEKILKAFSEQDASQVPVLGALKKSLQYLSQAASTF